MALHLRSHGNPEQGCLRSAVSRAYYSVLLTVKEELTSRSYEFPSEGSHGKLLGALKGTKDHHALRLKNKIAGLRKKRELADYELAEGDFDAQEVDDILTKCDALCQEFRVSVPPRLKKRIGEELEKRA